jgi:hypothetical protein
MQYPKQKLKKHSRKAIHDFSAKVKKAEYEDAKGICRICHSEPITQYHHINEKGMGGGRGLGIQINCLGLCNTCHNHNSTELLKQCDNILRHRIDMLFKPNTIYSLNMVSGELGISMDELYKQYTKGFLELISGDKVGDMVYTTSLYHIARWLGVA